jgi:hypothetical protein
MPKLLSRQMHADLRVGLKDNALLGHQIDTALDNGFIQLHVGNAVHEQPPDTIGALIHGDVMSSPV